MEVSKQRFVFIKSILKSLGLFSDFVPGESNAKRKQFSLLRKVFRFLGLYPNIRFKHFYYESPNSFMAPKVYEFTSMMKLTKFNKNDIILDLGCGEGTLTLAIAQSVKKAVGVDVISTAIGDAKFKAEELKGSIKADFHCEKLENLNFQEESFDKIFSFSVIEHIPNYMEIFQEVFKLLVKGGELIISVDSFAGFDPNVRAIHQKQFEVQKYYEKNELKSMLLGLGFSKVDVTPIFKSEFAKKWFIRVMNNPRENFGFFKRVYSFFLYHKIKYHENKVKQNDHGIFLLAKCIK